MSLTRIPVRAEKHTTQRMQNTIAANPTPTMSRIFVRAGGVVLFGSFGVGTSGFATPRNTAVSVLQ